MLLILTFALVAFGLIMVFSASSMSAAYYYNGDALYFTKKQILGVVLGIIGMIIGMNIHHTKLKKLTPLFFMGVLVLLVLVPFLGKEVKGARSWFPIGPLQLQPSEFAKVAVVMYLAALIAKKEEKFRDFKKGLLPALFIVGFVAFLIMLQPDFGSAFILSMGALLVIVVGGANLKQLAFLGVVGGALASMVLAVMVLTNSEFGYRMERITTFLDPWKDASGSGFHVIQSLYAFGHGGWTGAGFGQSIQKLHFLPAPHNDFIFSIIGEELGFLGSSLFLLIYLLFIWRGIIVALRATDTFASLTGIGIIGTIAIQALINLGGVTNSIPLTGVTLPLISYGGTSVLVTLASLGILLGISRDYNREAEEAHSRGSSPQPNRRKHAVSR